MLKKFSFICFKTLVLLDKFFKILSKKSFLSWFPDFFQEISYKSIEILDKKVNFFVPNNITMWRVNTFFIKEPETLEWINSFEKKENLIFWDIGANIGLYSIYNSLKNPKSTTIAFEPSSSNLRVLTRNISINNLEKNIKVVSAPLTNTENTFQVMKEGEFVEGGALNTFGKKYDFAGKEFKSKMNYSLIGTTIDYLVQNSILAIPDYIKIDVDGIEHLILEGGDTALRNKKIKSLSVEINENFEEQFKTTLLLMEKYEFKFLHKKRDDKFTKIKAGIFANSYNYIFIR